MKIILMKSKDYITKQFANRKNILRLLIGFAVMATVFAADMLTKRLIYGPIAGGSPDIILIQGVLRFTAVENTGASFGMFKEHTEILTAISLVTISIVFLVWFFTPSVKNFWYRFALVGIVAGGVGNLVDRISLGYVRDFIYFELIDFAVFNVADSALTVGTVMLIIYVIFYYGKTPNKTVKNG